MNTSIFYVNSAGFLCQWRGKIVSKDETSVVVRFSKRKVLRFNLKSLGCDFFVTTKTPVKDLGLSVGQASESISFDESTVERVLAAIGDNIAERWTGKGWAS